MLLQETKDRTKKKTSGDNELTLSLACKNDHRLFLSLQNFFFFFTSSGDVLGPD